jgi:hypothetical protein
VNLAPAHTGARETPRHLSLPALVCTELLRARRRPLTKACALLVVAVGAACSQAHFIMWSPDVAHMTLTGAFLAAFFGFIPATIIGLASGNEDRRLGTDKELYLAGISAARETAARIVGSAVAAVVLWGAAALAAFVVACVFAATGAATWSGAGAAKAAFVASSLREAVLLALVALPLLGGGAAALTALVRSELRAAALLLGLFVVYYAAISALGTRSGVVWVARLTPAGAAFQLATGSTMPGDAAFAVSRLVAVGVALAWFGGLFAGATWRAAHSEPLPAHRPLRRSRLAGRVKTPPAITRATAPARRPASLARRGVFVAALCALLFVAGVVARPLVSWLPANTFDGIYQSLTHQTDEDVVMAVATAVREGRWADANAYLGGRDIRSVAARFVASIRETPGGQLHFIRVGFGGAANYPAIQVESYRNGSYQGPVFSFGMHFAHGRWRIERIADRWGS